MKRFMIFCGLFAVLSCISHQNPLQLNTLIDNIPQGAYVKDLNNDLILTYEFIRQNYKGNEKRLSFETASFIYILVHCFTQIYFFFAFPLSNK